jgi:long-chain acyl-CoA synthetase
MARILTPEGAVVPSGTQGELQLFGPQVVPGYWRNLGATNSSIPDGNLRTGDVAIMDEQGWVCLVDRLKGQINVAEFKVWSREVEDVLYEHPSVLEVAVIEEKDEYRGETVVAYVSLKSGQTVVEQEFVDFARARLAAHKYPRRVPIIEDLPKTPTAKIRRRDLRDSKMISPVKAEEAPSS